MSYEHAVSHLITESLKEYLKDKFPYHSTRPYIYDEHRANEKKYAKWNVINVIMILVIIIGLPIPFAWLFHFLYKSICLLSIEDNSQFFPPTWVSFWPAALLFCLCTIILWIEGVQKIFMCDFDEYCDYYNTSVSYDNHKAGIFFSKILIAPFLILLILSISMSLTLDDNSIRYKRLFSISSKKYTYDQVTHIIQYNGRQLQNGTIKDEKTHEIVFNDENKFRSNFFFDDYELSRPFAEAVAEKTGLPIEQVPFEPFDEK